MNSETLKNYIGSAVAAALSDLKWSEFLDQPDIITPDPLFGDYSTNAALVLAKKVGAKPSDIAHKIIAHIQQHDIAKRFLKVEGKSGFINFTLEKNALFENMKKIHEQRELYGCSVVGEGKKVLFEYSSPNTNKPLHIGHTRNDVYGMACINLLKSQGYKVVSAEIINDRGIHIMKSMLMYMKHGQGQTPESEGLKSDHFVRKFYILFAKEASESEAKEKELMEEAQELLRKWESNDMEVRALWKQMNTWFYEGVKQTYEKEGSTFDEVDYESEIYDKGRDLVLEGVKKGVFTKEEDGSVSVDLTGQGLDKKYLLRKDGTTIYITQDLYLWHIRDERHHPDLAIVTTSAEQSYHFRVLAKIFELLNFPWAKNFKHLPYEHVFLGQSKMSSREGNAISADELLDSVKGRVKEIMSKSDRVKASLEDNALVQDIAFGAIKYGYLKYEPNTRIYFDLDSTISMEGNTGPYIQYAHARISSILRQAGDFSDTIYVLDNLVPAEEMLSRKLLHYGEVVELAAKEYKPNLLANYLYELASDFSRFYQEAPVLSARGGSVSGGKKIDGSIRDFRLQLVHATAQVLRNGLHLLGIEAPEEM